MKKLILSISVLFWGVIVFAQSSSSSPAKWPQQDSLMVGYLLRIAQHTAPCYKLYPTENMWTFLELETYSGRIWQVQYSIKGPDYRFKSILNDRTLIPLSDTDGEYAGRFELYPTQNMYNFVLLDTETGDTWQVQWSTESEKRGIMSIW